MTNNLPDDVLPSDIDEHFGAPSEKQKLYYVDAKVGVVVEGYEYEDSEEILDKAAQKIYSGEADFAEDKEIVHVEPAP